MDISMTSKLIINILDQITYRHINGCQARCLGCCLACLLVGEFIDLWFDMVNCVLHKVSHIFKCSCIFLGAYFFLLNSLLPIYLPWHKCLAEQLKWWRDWRLQLSWASSPNHWWCPAFGGPSRQRTTSPQENQTEKLSTSLHANVNYSKI